MEAGQCQQGKIWSPLPGCYLEDMCDVGLPDAQPSVQVQKGMQGIDTRIVNPKVKGTLSICF